MNAEKCKALTINEFTRHAGDYEKMAEVRRAAEANRKERQQARRERRP